MHSTHRQRVFLPSSAYSMSMLIVDRHLLYPPLGAPQFKRFLDGSRLGTDRVAPATARQLMQLVWLGG